jgi:hypothetical protein
MKKNGDQDNFMLPSKFNEDSGSELRNQSLTNIEMDIPLPMGMMPTKFSQYEDFMGLRDETSILQQEMTEEDYDRLLE